MKSFTALTLLSLAAVGSVIAAPYDESYSTFARCAPQPSSPSVNARLLDSPYSDFSTRDYYEPSSVYRRDYDSLMMDVYSQDDGYSAPKLYRRAGGGGQQVPSSYLTGSSRNTPPPPPRKNNGPMTADLPIQDPPTYYGLLPSKPPALNPANGGYAARAPPTQATTTRNTTPASAPVVKKSSSGGQQLSVAQMKSMRSGSTTKNAKPKN
ncbi:hypothetical protein C8Q75DRAFT_869950 [Abortiporus biennis]|nr:hypothetical protein C8Q75DRAFT_869950 [Abortiporus biennis]